MGLCILFRLLFHFAEAIIVIVALGHLCGKQLTGAQIWNQIVQKVGAIVLFSIMNSSIGVILQLIEERVPFAGKIAVWIIDGAWAIAFQTLSTILKTAFYEYITTGTVPLNFNREMFKQLMTVKKTSIIFGG